MLKRIISLLLALAMLAGYMPPMHVFAEEMVNAEYDATEETVAETEPFVEFTEVVTETVAEPTQPAVPEETAAPTEETVAPTEEPEEILQVEEFVYTSEADYTSEELYEAYAASLFFGNSFSFFGTAAGEMLTGDEKTLYDALVPFIKQVACGQRESASISIGQALTGYPVDVEATFTGSGFTGTQLGRVIDALMADLPFEFYWYEKTSGCSASRISTGSSLLQIILSFSVADNYNTGDPFTADTAKTGAAAQSAARAKDIVNTYASKSDYEKLVGYKEEICDLVDYNWNAAWDNVFSTDIDPWQLIYVFDGNPETRVVCEGYSKAFQYLCDLTDFKSDVTCYAVTGFMDGGGHMWNIVSIKDVNYFADVTNSDSDSIGYDGSLFLAGASGSVATGYTIGGIRYVYDEDTKILWGAGEDSILNLSSVKYTPPAPGEEEDEPLASGTCGENLTWTLDDAGTLTISGSGAMSNWYWNNPAAPWYDHSADVKTVVIEYGVTSIGEYAFFDCRILTSVEIPDSVTSIGDYVFINCLKLKNVMIPNSVTNIGDGAFYCCSSLTSIEIPDSVTSIGNKVFCHCKNLNSVVIPDSVTSIGGHAFYSCESLTSIAIPDSVTSIGRYAFSRCTRLRTIEIPDGVTSIGEQAFGSCEKLKSVVLPDSVTTIGDAVFKSCSSLTSIDIPDSVTSIGKQTFGWCSSLTSVEIPNGVISIGEQGFYSCDNLKSIVIPDSVISIDSHAFAHCDNLKSVLISNSVTSIGDRAFSDCVSLTSIEIPDGVTSVGDGAFSHCVSLTSIEIPSSVTSIGTNPFLECKKLKGIWVAEANVAYCNDNYGVLFNKDMSELISVPFTIKGSYQIPDSVTSIGESAFGHCENLKSIVIPDGVTSIGSSAFSYCSKLTDITIPEGVTRIEIGTFEHCLSLVKITFTGNRPYINNWTFGHVEATAYYPIDNPTWTAEGLYNYGGKLTWIASCTKHSPVIAEAAAPTCTEEGLTEGSYCAKCNEVLSVQQTVPAMGHDFEVTVTDPTCTTDGEKRSQCLRCGHIETNVLPAVGHKEVTNAAVAPTCTATGLTEGKRCAACNEVLVAQTVIDALGHTEVIDAAVAPTCTETGLTEGKHCSVCNEVLVAQEVVDALGHAEVIDEAVAATCTETGLTEGKHCSVCNEILVAQEVIDALGHTEVVDEAVDPDCTNTGLTEGKHCSVCDEVLVAQEVVDALGHKEVIDKGFAPDCTNTGLTEGSHCSVCGEICVAQEVIPALGHAYEAQNEEIVCTVCGETVTIHIHQDYVALDIYENPQVQLNVDVSPKTLEDDLQWRIEGAAGVLEPVQNGLVTALHAGTVYVVAELTVDGYTISSRCRVDVTENVQVKGVQLSTNKVTTELYKDEYATFEILLDLPQNHPFEGNELMVTDDAAMAASGLENKSNLIESVQFKTISDLFVLELLDDRTVQIVPTQKAMKEGVKGTPSDTVVVTLRNGQTLETTEKLSLTVKKTLPKLKATIASFNSFYEGQSQKIVITGADVTGIRKNENEKTPIPTWLELEDGCLKLNGNAPKASDKAYLLVDVDGWVNPVELTLTVKHAKKVPGIKLAATTVTVTDRNASTEVELKLQCSSKTDVLKDLNITGITAPKGYSVENFNAEDGTFTLKKDGGFTSDKITLTVAYGSETKDLTLNVKTQAVKLKLSSSKVSLNKELPDQAVVEVICATENYNFDLKDAVLTYDGKMLDIERAGNALIIKLKDGAEYGKTYPVSVSAYKGAPAVKLSVAVLKEGSVVKNTIKATGTLDVIREGTAITVTSSYTNYLNVNVDTDAVLKIYSSKDSFKKAIAEVYAENGIFTIDSSIIGNHTLKYKAQLETKIPGKTDPIKSNQISLSVKMGAAKLTAKSSGTTMFAKDRNDRAIVWFEAADASLNDVSSVKIKDAKYKDVFEIIDYRDGSFAIAFKDGKLHESVANQLEKKSSVSITLSLDVFMEGNESAKANTTQKVKLTIVK